MLTLLMLGQAPSAESVIQRMEQFLAKADTLSVMVKSKMNGHPIATSTVRVDRPYRLNMTAKFSGIESLFILNESGGIEIERGSFMYATHPAFGQIYLPKFKVNGGLAYVAPAMLLRGTAKGLFPSASKPTLGAKTTVNGVAVDYVTGRIKDQMQDVDIKAWIDAGGRIMRLSVKTATPQGTQLIEHEMSGYVANQKLPDNLFAVSLPLGYVPYQLQSADFGIGQGEALPGVTLQAAESGKAEGLKGLCTGKNTFVLVADPDFHANAALFASLKNISSKIPDYHLVVISNRRDVANAKRLGVANTYFDPTGTELAKLALPGAPAMYLVNKKGNVTQMFFGFDGAWEGLDKVVERLKKGG